MLHRWEILPRVAHRLNKQPRVIFGIEGSHGKYSMQGSPKINKWLTPFGSNLLWHSLSCFLALDSSLGSGSDFCSCVTVCVCFSSAGVQSVCDCEQEGSRVEEKGSHHGHREADLQWLLASGEMFYDWSLNAPKTPVQPASPNLFFVIYKIISNSATTA